nr:tryptophan synthase subunit alpha [Lachnospiraceae bacterium]
EITTDIGAMVELVRKANPGIPVYIGFGISDTKTAREMAAVSDGVIVGSAIVKIIAEYGEKSIPEVEAFVRSMKEAANT